MTWLALLFAFEVGMTPQVGMLAYNETISADAIEYGIYYTQLEAEMQFWQLLFIGGAVRTYIVPGNSDYTFSPRYSSYDFTAGLRYKMLELGWRHRCFHPMMPYMPILDVDVRGIEGWYDELYLRVEVER